MKAAARRNASQQPHEIGNAGAHLCTREILRRLQRPQTAQRGFQTRGRQRLDDPELRAPPTTWPKGMPRPGLLPDPPREEQVLLKPTLGNAKSTL
jgi:hypothetical protein